MSRRWTMRTPASPPVVSDGPLDIINLDGTQDDGILHGDVDWSLVVAWRRANAPTPSGPFIPFRWTRADGNPPYWMTGDTPLEVHRAGQEPLSLLARDFDWEDGKSWRLQNPLPIPAKDIAQQDADVQALLEAIGVLNWADAKNPAIARVCEAYLKVKE